MSCREVKNRNPRVSLWSWDLELFEHAANPNPEPQARIPPTCQTPAEQVEIPIEYDSDDEEVKKAKCAGLPDKGP